MPTFRHLAGMVRISDSRFRRESSRNIGNKGKPCASASNGVCERTQHKAGIFPAVRFHPVGGYPFQFENHFPAGFKTSSRAVCYSKKLMKAPLQHLFFTGGLQYDSSKIGNHIITAPGGKTYYFRPLFLSGRRVFARNQNP